MSQKNTEIEAKYMVHSLQPVEERLQALNAKLVESRGFEYNLRYDDAKGRLTDGRRVLRLRKFHDARLTYKGPSEVQGNTLARSEIEVVVSDFDNTRLILEALGYRVNGIYEKYRAMYELKGNLITLDELPYGLFVEVEGESPQNVADTASVLGLDPTKAIPASYQGIFERLRALHAPHLQSLTFSQFQKTPLHASLLGFPWADE